VTTWQTEEGEPTAPRWLVNSILAAVAIFVAYLVIAFLWHVVHPGHSPYWDCVNGQRAAHMSESQCDGLDGDPGN